MKTMTCRQLGGPCDAPFRGTTADEVIKADDKHLKEAVGAGDETHRRARKSMQDRWKTPSLEWAGISRHGKAFAALPQEQ